MFKRYAYGWVIGCLFIGSALGHWIFGWFEYVNDQIVHGTSPLLPDYLAIMLSRTFENWQSEFLQLLCQVGLLTWFMFKGSPQSKDTHDRMERKIDEVRKILDDLDDRLGRY